MYSMFRCTCLDLLLRVTHTHTHTHTHTLINGHFLSFLSFCYLFPFSFDTLKQYCYILCSIHQCGCINVSVIIIYISVDLYNIITDTLIHSYYCILVNSQLVFCHFLFSSKSKIDYG